MAIGSRLRKLSTSDLVEKISEKIPSSSCLDPGDGTLGALYLSKVLQVFIETLPEDETDIYMHVKNRNDQRWGVDTDSVIPFKGAHTAITLGLLNWDYDPRPDEEQPEPGERITAGMILGHHLKTYTSALVEVLCDAAIEAHEDGPEDEYVAIINVPGYSPMAEEPAEFPTIASAWEYLADERCRSEEQDETTDEYSDTVEQLRTLAEAADPQCGSVYGGTPGYDGDHDLGLVYTVTHRQD